MCTYNGRIYHLEVFLEVVQRVGLTDHIHVPTHTPYVIHKQRANTTDDAIRGLCTRHDAVLRTRTPVGDICTHCALLPVRQ